VYRRFDLKYPPHHIAWSPDGRWILTCSSDSTIDMWDVQLAKRAHTYRRHTKPVAAVAWLPDSLRFVSGGVDGNLCVWSTDGGCLAVWQEHRVTDLVVCNTRIALRTTAKCNTRIALRTTATATTATANAPGYTGSGSSGSSSGRSSGSSSGSSSSENIQGWKTTSMIVALCSHTDLISYDIETGGSEYM
jgi:WD40 repeat protein